MVFFATRCQVRKQSKWVIAAVLLLVIITVVRHFSSSSHPSSATSVTVSTNQDKLNKLIGSITQQTYFGCNLNKRPSFCKCLSQTMHQNLIMNSDLKLCDLNSADGMKCAKKAIAPSLKKTLSKASMANCENNP